MEHEFNGSSGFLRIKITIILGLCDDGYDVRHETIFRYSNFFLIFYVDSW